MTKRRYGWLACAGILALLSGCVERRFVINTDPPGALVYVNNRPVGSTPVDLPFIYYGKYLITIEKDGYETRHIEQEVSPTWYAYPPLDFIFENLYPLKISDVRRLPEDENGFYKLQLLPRQNPDVLRFEAEELRLYGKNNIPAPTVPVPPPTNNNPVPDPRAASNPPPR